MQDRSWDHKQPISTAPNAGGNDIHCHGKGLRSDSKEKIRAGQALNSLTLRWKEEEDPEEGGDHSYVDHARLIWR